MNKHMKKVSAFIMLLLIITLVFTPVISSQAAVKTMTLNKTSTKLKLGGTLQLKASNADSSVTWSSQDNKIATVKNGLVTAKSTGTVNIKAKSKKTTAICKVTVYQPAKKVELVTSLTYLEPSCIFTVSAKFLPENTTYQSLTWSVENIYPYKALRHISKNKFEAIDGGYATIVAYQKETNKTYRFKIGVDEPLGPFQIESNGKKVTSLSTFVGGHLVINGAMADPLYIFNYWYREKMPTFTYSIKDKSIASVDKRGQITGLKAGTTTAIVTAENGKSETCTITVTNERKSLQIETLYADNFFHPVEISNYGQWTRYSGADKTFIYKLANNQIGMFSRVSTKGSQKIELHVYDKDLKHVSEKSIALPYTEWGGFYQGEDGNYYAAIGQKNTEQDNSKIVFCIIKYDSNFNELARCNITGGESITRVPYDVGIARMTMNGSTLIVHTDRERYTTPKDGLNHQSNITLMIDTTTMKQDYVGGSYPYNHVSHSFNQFVKMDGNNLIFVDHGDGTHRSIYLKSQPNFTPFGWTDNYYKGPETNDLYLLRIVGSVGDNTTGTKVNGFELGKNNNLVAGVSIPHDKLTKDDLYDYETQNVYVSLISKDITSSKLIWLTDYKEGKNITANNLRMLKISDDEFALIYQIKRKKEDLFTYSTGLILIDSNGKVLKKKELDMFYSCYVQPLYYNGSILLLDSIDYNDKYFEYDEDTKFTVEPSQFIRIYLD